MSHKDREERREYKTRWNKQYYKKHKKQEIERTKRRKYELRKWIREYKERLGCLKCGEKHPACLEFHHLNKNKKEFGISDSIERNGYSKSRFLSEIKKCIVLCANCHRKLHA
ncbi:MAG: hypothetical protein HYW25_02350 [Candidatus Aenigmarchaeota archaeon]|nr:hypothetical protein [Candidatus Aenigmarchaeota archaeon]